MKTFSFNEQLEIGDVGEKHFKEHYANLGPVKSDKYEVDFFLKNGKSVELKTDSYDMEATDNFFMEMISDINSGKLGGVFRAKQDNVDLFVYYFLKNKTFFWFDVNKLHQRVEDLILTNKYKIKSIKNRRWTTQGYALPRSKFEDIIAIKQTF